MLILKLGDLNVQFSAVANPPMSPAFFCHSSLAKLGEKFQTKK